MGMSGMCAMEQAKLHIRVRVADLSAFITTTKSPTTKDGS